MFGTIRKHSQALWIPIIIVIVISFVVYFTPGFDPLDNRGRGQSETDEELKYARQQVLLEQAMAARTRALSQLQYMPPESRNQLMQYIPGMINQALNEVSGRMSQMPPRHLMDLYPTNQQQYADLDDYESLDDYPALDYQAQLRMLRLQKAHALGIRVGHETAVKRVENMFSSSNVFSQVNYTNFLSQFERSGFLAPGDAGKEQFREFIRERIVMRQLDELMTRSSGLFPDNAIEASLIESNRKYTAQAVFFPSSNHLSSVTNAIDSNGTLLIKHFDTLTDRYRIEPKRKIGYVKISSDHYLQQAEEKIKFATLVTNRIKLHHSSTNAAEFFTDTNSTKKLPDGPALIAAARAKVREMQQVPIKDSMQKSAQKEARAFFGHIFENQPEEDWTLTRLKQESAAWKGEGKQPLHYQEANASRYDTNSTLPKSLVDSIYGGLDPRNSVDPFASAAEGTLYPRLIEVPDKGFYLIGLAGNIAGRPRNFEELNDKEKDKVKENFVNKESSRLTEEGANDFREVVEELMKTGQAFADVVKDENSTQPSVLLPPMKLSGTNQVTELKGLATLRQIQDAIRANPDEVKPGWTSQFTSAVNEKSDGFIVHVSAVEAGEPPTPTELQSEAKEQRENVRNNYFNWLQSDMEALNKELATAALVNRLTDIPYQYGQASSELKELNTLISNIESGKRKEDDDVPLRELQNDRQKVVTKLNTLKLMNTKSLPALLKKAHDEYVSLTGDNEKFTKKIKTALAKAKKFEAELKAE